LVAAVKREGAGHRLTAREDASRLVDSTDDAQPATSASFAGIRSIFSSVLLVTFLAALDQTVVAAALPTIGRELGDFELLPWVVTIYLLTATAVTQLYGKAADIYGRRSMLLLAIGIFVVGSVACALAPSVLVLVVARGVQGLGAGGLLSVSHTVVGDVISPRERGRYQAYLSAAWAAASVAGPVTGGFLAQYMSWTLIFWINLPIGLAALVLTNAQLKRLPRYERPHKLDFIGAGLMTLATVAFLLALSWGGVRYSWTSAPILSLLATAAVVGALFVLRQTSAPEPLIPREVLADPIVICATLAMSLTVGTFIGMIVFVPIYLEIVIGLPASSAGTALIPVVMATVVGAVLAGRVMYMVDRYKWATIVGLAFSVCAVAFLATSPVELPLALIEVLLTTTSFGIGTAVPVTIAAIQNVVAPHQLGSATASYNFFRQLAGALAVAAFGAVVFGGDAHAGLGPHGLTYQTIQVSGAEFLQRFRFAFAMMAVTLAIAVVMILLMEERPLRGDQPDSSVGS
jgi:EmrB/QacA subfamily drug resistance transporter